VRRVAITGANSAVGREMLRCAGSESVDPVACVRSERAEEQLPEGTARVARVGYDDPASLDRAFDGCEAVAHLPGVLVESRQSSYEQANVETTRSVVASAKRCGVRKLVLVSALGADATSHNRYYRTKGEAEDCVRGSGIAFTILRAPLVLGPGTEGAAALRRNTAGPAATLIGGGHQRQQPLDVGDLARATLRAADPERARDLTLEIAGEEALLERELVERAAASLGRRVRIRGVPVWLMRTLLRLRPGPGFSAEALEVVTADTNVDPAPAARALGLELTPVDDMLRRSLEAA
jgi:NADH dehydrogenase